MANHAAQAGLKPTQYLKKAALAYVQEQYLVPAGTDEKLADIIFLLRNMANSLNQLAGKANTLKKVAVFDLLKAKKTVHGLEDLIKSFVHHPSQHDSKIPDQNGQKFRPVAPLH